MAAGFDCRCSCARSYAPPPRVSPLRVWAGTSVSTLLRHYVRAVAELRRLAAESAIVSTLTVNFFDGKLDDALCDGSVAKVECTGVVGEPWRRVDFGRRAAGARPAE